jgi:hypothetical protein
MQRKVDLGLQETLTNSTGMQLRVEGSRTLACEILRDLVATGTPFHLDVEITISTDRGSPLRFHFTNERLALREPVKKNFHPLDDVSIPDLR